MPDEQHGQNQLPESDEGISSNHEKTTGATNTTKKKCRITPRQFRCATLIFDGLLVIVGAAYTFFACQQWLAMNGQLEAMNGQLSEMRKSTAAATDSANAAKSSVDLSRESSRLDQRAWIHIPMIGGQPALGEPWKIKITAKNTGKTAATNFFLIAKVMVKNISENPDFATELQKITGSKPPFVTIGGVLGPNESTARTFGDYSYGNNPLYDTDIKYLKEPTIETYVFGEATYRDIFNCYHSTKFCVRWLKDGSGFEPVESFNGFDDSCP